jgi:hypothetical protein
MESTPRARKQNCNTGINLLRLIRAYSMIAVDRVKWFESPRAFGIPIAVCLHLAGNWIRVSRVDAIWTIRLRHQDSKPVAISEPHSEIVSEPRFLAYNQIAESGESFSRNPSRR